MSERFETVVVGAGQAGLAVSYHLTQRDREHVVLERGRIGESWRTQRWDSFRLNTPNFFLRLPGYEYTGDEPDAFLTLAETVAHLERYAQNVKAPVRTGIQVSSLRAGDTRGYVVETSDGSLEADNVVVATGSFRRPAPPPVSNPSASIVQLHASEYRNPDQLPAGGVLVVGSGQSGCQIAEDLRRQGRRIYISVGRCPTLPLFYRGRDVYRWLIDLGMMDETVDTLPSPGAKLACNPTVGGDGVGHLRAPRRLARDGVELIGRVEAIEGSRVVVRPDLEERLAEADEFLGRFKGRVDEYARGAGLDLPEEPPEQRASLTSDVRELDLSAAGVQTVIWANGYRPDFGWIELPVFDADGWPVQTRGVSDAPGLYFVGLHWLHKRKSALLLGVGEDAEFVVSQIAGA